MTQIVLFLALIFGTTGLAAFIGHRQELAAKRWRDRGERR